MNPMRVAAAQTSLVVFTDDKSSRRSDSGCIRHFSFSPQNLSASLSLCSDRDSLSLPPPPPLPLSLSL